MIEQIDVGELVHGYAIGKAVRMSDWLQRREQQQFDVLVNRLRVKKWYREVKADGGERLAALRKYKREWALEHRDRDAVNRKDREARRLKHAKSPTLICVACGVEFPKPFRRGQPPKYCTTRCYQRFRYRQRAEAEGRTVRACKRRGDR